MPVNSTMQRIVGFVERPGRVVRVYATGEQGDMFFDMRRKSDGTRVHRGMLFRLFVSPSGDSGFRALTACCVKVGYVKSEGALGICGHADLRFGIPEVIPAALHPHRFWIGLRFEPPAVTAQNEDSVLM